MRKCRGGIRIATVDLSRRGGLVAPYVNDLPGADHPVGMGRKKLHRTAWDDPTLSVVGGKAIRFR